jgi:hypothetical protein
LSEKLCKQYSGGGIEKAERERINYLFYFLHIHQISASPFSLNGLIVANHAMDVAE